MTRLLRSQCAGLQGESSLGIMGRTSIVPSEAGHWAQAHSCRQGLVEGPPRPSRHPIVEVRIMASQRHANSNPNSENLWTGYISWQRRIKDKDETRVANEVTLKYRGGPDVLGDPSVMTRVLNMGQKAEEPLSERSGTRRTCLAVLDFECRRGEETREEGSLNI